MPIKFISKPIKDMYKAIEIARPFIIDKTYTKSSPMYKHVKAAYKETAATPAPKHAISSRWSMTVDAMERTLGYIFNYLGHKCYMLCVSQQNHKKVYQLDVDNLATPISNAVATQIAHIDENRTITRKQKERIREMAQKPMRLLQCVLKPGDNDAVIEDDDGDESGMKNE